MPPARPSRRKPLYEPSPRRTRRFRLACDGAHGAIAAAAGKRGFAEPDVLMRWIEIVGESHAALCLPLKVIYPPRGIGATLVVRTSGARAPEVEHLTPRLLERVNRFYGYRAVTRIRIEQTSAPGFAEAQAAFAGPGNAASRADAEPTAEQVSRAAEMTADIAHDGLRDALSRMGAHILKRAAAGAACAVPDTDKED